MLEEPPPKTCERWALHEGEPPSRKPESEPPPPEGDPKREERA
jgi:hypothetical protein